jgi:ATPase subunit of ABC transporter with duplicated ATPase domains
VNAEGGEGEDEEDEEGDDEEPDFSNMSKKDIAKHEKRRAKAAQRQQEEAYREERREREEKRMEALREREQQKEKEFELKQQEADRLRKIEEKRLADAYNAWKDPVVVEDSEEVLSNICSYVIDKKVVSIEAMAKIFSLPTYVCVKNVEKLIDSQRLVGVINGDGNVICLTDENGKVCSSYLQSHGRVDKDSFRQELNRTVAVH